MKVCNYCSGRGKVAEKMTDLDIFKMKIVEKVIFVPCGKCYGKGVR